MTTQQHHLVFGAGLIGGFVAGGLMQAGLTTTLVARAKTQQEMAGGLTLSDYLGNHCELAAPAFASEAETTAPVDFLWLTVKCTAVRASLEELANFVGPDTTIICCQNGLGSDVPIRQRFPQNLVLGGVVGYNVAAPEAGKLHRSTEGKLVLQEHPSLHPVMELINSPLFPCGFSADFIADQWAKLQLNLANPVGALSDIPIKEMLEQHDYRVVVVALQKELLMVTKAMNVNLPKLTVLPPSWLPRMLGLSDFWFKLLGQKMLAIDPTARFSMWWDLHLGKPTEIEFLNQAVVAAADELQLDAPYNRAVVSLIRQVEAGKASIGFSGRELRDALNL